MIRRLSAAITALCLCFCASAQKVVFVPQWTPQAQFAGFYVARDKGFFAEEGLDVTIRHIGVNSTSSAIDMQKDGSAQIIGSTLIQSLIQRADGTKLVNAMQLAQHSGLLCVGRSAIDGISGLDGLRIGKWRSGFCEPLEFLQLRENLDIEWIPFINGISLYVYGAVDATVCYSYNEYIQLVLATGGIPEENIFRVSDGGIDWPDDGIYVTEQYYDKNRDTVEKFTRAAARGWQYAREHRDEALAITRKYIDEAHIVTNDTLQEMMLDECLRLQEKDEPGRSGFEPVSRETFDSMVDGLLSCGVITRKVEYGELIR